MAFLFSLSLCAVYKNLPPKPSFPSETRIMSTSAVPLTQLTPSQFYLGYIVYPQDLHDASPSVSSPPDPTEETTTPTTPTIQRSFNAADPAQDSYKRLRDPKYHPVLVHQYDLTSNIATIFICNTHPLNQHRFCPLANSCRLPNQPPQSIVPHPAGAFEDAGSYINFSHPIECRVVFKSSRIRGMCEATVPGRALHVRLKDAVVTLDAAEKKKLMQLHWRYWAGRRYNPDGGDDAGEDYDVGGGGNDGGHHGGDGRGEEVVEKESVCHFGGDSEAKSGGGGASSGVNRGTAGDRAHWRQVVIEALNNPEVPEEEEPSQLPQLHICSPLPAVSPDALNRSSIACGPEAQAAEPFAYGELWGEKYGHRLP